MRMSDKPRRSISVGRAATVDDLNAGWELAHEIMHFGFLRESPASLYRREYRHLRRANRARHDRAFLPASTVWDEMLRDAVEAQVLSYLARAKALSVGLSKAVSNRSAFVRWSTSNGTPSRTAVYGPVRTAVVRGQQATAAPYADQRGRRQFVIP